jgi:D-glycero-alpha-D-manno-heptose-7-phosphate kinase
MIISKTPYRISFFGGGSDYPDWYLKNGGEVISSTIDKYVYISLRNLPKFFPHNYRVSYSIVEETKNIHEIKHKVVREMLKKFKLKKGLEIHYDGDLPSKSGMGSSSAFIVGLLHNINVFSNTKINKKILAVKSLNFEQKVLKELVGSQDQIACSYGGFNSIQFLKNGNFKIKNYNHKKKFLDKLNNNLFLIYTGQQRNSQNIVKNFIDDLNKKKESQIYKIIDYVEIAKKYLLDNSHEEFCEMIADSWNIKKSIHKSISNKRLDDLYDYSINCGAEGGKLLGAGGGGFFLFYVKDGKKKKFLKKMKNNQIISYNFEKSGSQLIYSN